MKYRVMEFLACPKCKRQNLSIEEKKSIQVPIFESHFVNAQRDGVQISDRKETEIIEGVIHCSDCGATYPIEDGIPNFLLHEPGASTQHRHTIFDQSIPVWEKQFLEITAPLLPKDFLGKLVVDVGCGYGSHSYYAALYVS